MYIGKPITKLANFVEINGLYYINLEFIGQFKIGEKVGIVKRFDKREGKYKEFVIIQIHDLNETIKEVSDDPLEIKIIIDNDNESQRIGHKKTQNCRMSGYVIGEAILKKPYRIKKSFKRYKTLVENGFIGTNDELVLENKSQYGLSRSIRKFLQCNEKYIKAINDNNRTTTYEFSKYGIRGKIDKMRDGIGAMTLYSPSNEEVRIEYLIKEEYDKIFDTIIRSNKNKYYENITQRDKERMLNEINHIIESVGGDKFIK